MIQILLFTFLLAFALSVTTTAWASCPVTLTVLAKRADVILGHGGNIPETHSVILRRSKDMNESEACSAYASAQEFSMNNVEQHDQVFQSLKPGNVITGTLNYHRPSPHGKMLNENYHHGLRLLTTEKKDFSQEYIYFRHIGLY